MTRRFRGFVFLALCALSWPGSAAADDLTYLVHAPTQPSAHPPLIVLLHGAGADEHDMIGLWRNLPPTFVVISPRAPFGGGGYRWYRKAGASPRAGDLELSRKVVDLIVDSAIQRFNADPNRIFLGGFSQGAVMTYEVALHEPGRFRGAAVLSGSLFASTTKVLQQTDRSNESFFIAHGTADPRIPVSAATAARAALTRLGVPVVFHTYAGMGHETGAAEVKDFGAWVQERSSN